jgi:D-alanyl-D-alanine carboxypeptidase
MACFRLLFFVVTLLGASLLAAKDVRPAYVGAIVVEAETGQVLFEDKADVTNPPASMTKLMTYAVLHDKLIEGSLKLDTLVTVNRDEAKFAMKSDSTAVWLKEKETFPVEELIYAMMVQSANDASLTLARVAAGSPEAFVELMNAKARALGMTRTTFRTPHGLSKGRVDAGTTDVTTARDYATLSRYLVQMTDVLKYTAVKRRPFGAGQRTQLVDMTNHNNLLGKFAGLDGLKTGYTSSAGFCLAATAIRDGRRIITVVVGSPTSKTRDLKVIELLERGFGLRAAPVPVVRTDAPAGPAPVPKLDQPEPHVKPEPPVKTEPTKEPAVIFRVIPPQKKP